MTRRATIACGATGASGSAPSGSTSGIGGQRECIACAACIDACREVTSRRNVAPFIAYRGTVLRGKAHLFAGGCLAAALVLLAALWSRPDVRFAVQWEGTAGRVPAFETELGRDRIWKVLAYVDSVREYGKKP